MSMKNNETQHQWETMTEEALCAMAVSGSRDAEEVLVLRYSRLVKICARPYFLVGADSEDVIQEGMLGLLAAIREFSAERKVTFRTFAELCIRRRIISAVRMASGGKHNPLNTYVSLELSLFVGTQGQPSFEAALSRQENPEDVIINRENLKMVQQMIQDELTALENHILGFYLNGLSYSEIAKETGRSTKSVDNAVQRIRRKIAQQLKSGGHSES